jgi:hypothetical protein
MYALTLKQPWAHLIFNEDKDIENRTWKLPFYVKNCQVAIHAGKGYEKGFSDIPKENLVFGAIIGTVVFTDCLVNSPSKWALIDQYHWVIKDAILLPEPIYCKGNQGFWRTDANSLTQIICHSQTVICQQKQLII